MQGKSCHVAKFGGTSVCNAAQFKKIKELIITTEPLEKTTTQKVKRFKEIEKILKK